MLTGIGGDPWIEAVAQMVEVPLVAVKIGPGCEAEDPLGDWAKLSGVSEAGCVLVRPDQFVAWRSSDVKDTSPRDLRDALASVLGYPKH